MEKRNSFRKRSFLNLVATLPVEDAADLSIKSESKEKLQQGIAKSLNRGTEVKAIEVNY